MPRWRLHRATNLRIFFAVLTVLNLRSLEYAFVDVVDETASSCVESLVQVLTQYRIVFCRRLVFTFESFFGEGPPLR